MRNTLYFKYGVHSSYEQELRRKLKNIMNSTPPNTTTLNKKAETKENPRLFSANAHQFMIIDTGLPMKNKQIEGQPGQLFLRFVENSTGFFELEKYFIVSDWYELYEKLICEFEDMSEIETGLETNNTYSSFNINETVTEEEQEDADRQGTTTNNASVLVEQVISASDTTEEPSSLQQYYAEHKDDVDAHTLDTQDIVSKPEEDSLAISSSTNNEALISNEILTDVLACQTDEIDLSSYISNIMTSCNTNDFMPPISVFYACVKSNGLQIDANVFKRLISRLTFLEWTDWLFDRIITTKELTHTAKFLINSGFIKSDGQPLYIIVDVDKNYPRYIKLDCSLVDIKAAGLSKSDARNQLMLWNKDLKNNPLSLDSIDLGNNVWKNHILNARQYRFGLYKDLDYDTRMNMVLNSIEHACLLEAQGVDVKRVVRGGINNVSVAIPLRYRNNNMTSMAIILTLNRHNVWEVSTIEADKDLTDNIKTYNFYNMPSWLREVN